MLRGPAKDENISEVPLFMPSGRQYEPVGGNYLFVVHMELLDYGHLLTEGLARVWFLLKHRQEAAGGADPRPYVRRGESEDRHPSVTFSKPVRLEQVADCVLDGQAAVTDRRPLFLSTSKLGSSRRKVEHDRPASRRSVALCQLPDARRPGGQGSHPGFR